MLVFRVFFSSEQFLSVLNSKVRTRRQTSTNDCHGVDAPVGRPDKKKMHHNDFAQVRTFYTIHDLRSFLRSPNARRRIPLTDNAAARTNVITERPRGRIAHPSLRVRTGFVPGFERAPSLIRFFVLYCRRQTRARPACTTLVRRYRSALKKIYIILILQLSTQRIL